MLKTIYPIRYLKKLFSDPILMALVVLVLSSQVLYAQQRTITGTVSSTDTEETLPGVNILVKRSNQGTATDIDGNYSIQVSSPDAVLSFSFIGFQTQEVRVGNNSTIDVSLVPELSALSKVVVVGYGTQERATVSGAISSVSSEQIRALPVPNLTSALQGRAAGVSVTNSGAPGNNPIVRVRGIGTV